MERLEREYYYYYGKLMLRKCAVIESVNDFLKNICDIEHSRHRSVTNFLVNLILLWQLTLFFRKSSLFVLLLICRRIFYACLTDFSVELTLYYTP